MARVSNGQGGEALMHFSTKSEFQIADIPAWLQLRGTDKIIKPYNKIPLLKELTTYISFEPYRKIEIDKKEEKLTKVIIGTIMDNNICNAKTTIQTLNLEDKESRLLATYRQRFLGNNPEHISNGLKNAIEKHNEICAQIYADFNK